MSGGFGFSKGTRSKDPTTFCSIEYYAAQRHVHAGGTINILHQGLERIAGIVEPGKLSHLFVELPVLQDMIGATGKVSQIYLKLDNPANTDLVMEYLKASSFTDYPIYSMEELLSLLSVNNIPALRIFIDVVIGIGMVIGLLRRFSFHVHGRPAANARDRHSEIAGSDERFRDGADSR